MKPLHKEVFICLDCEATGLDFDNDAIVELAAVKFTLEENLESYETLIDPCQTIPDITIKIHGITNEMVQGKPKIKEVLPAIANGIADPVMEGDQVLYYIGYSDKNKENLAGYILSVIGKGYQSDIETMVGLNPEGKIVAIKILSQLETPGLGTRLEEINAGEDKPWFQVQFSGKKLNQLMVDKDGGPIDSITGATISCRAVTLSIKKAMRDLGKTIGGFREELD